MVATIFFIFIWILPLGVREFRSSSHLLLAYWFVILLHQTVAFTNAFVFTTFGADADAATFHLVAVEIAESGEFFFGIGARFYENMLGVLYWLFGSSHLLGQQFSILAFAFSCIVLIKIHKLLNLSRNSALALIVFGALPTMVLLGSVTLRESYQVLFFMLAVYFGVKMHIKGGVNIHFIFMTMSALVMGLFHHGLIVYSGFLIILLMVWSLQPATHLLRIKKLQLMAVIITPVLLLAMVILSNMQIYGLGAITGIIGQGAFETASGFRELSVPDARATYGVVLDLSSPVMAIYSSMLLFLHYLFAPFPWQIRSVMDIYAALESIMRMVLIYYAIKQWQISSGAQRRLIALMLILFFSMTFMWAMGTTNYGTAMRHHMVSWWILVVTGLPLLMRQLGRIRLMSTNAKHSSKANNS